LPFPYSSCIRQEHMSSLCPFPLPTRTVSIERCPSL